MVRRPGMNRERHTPLKVAITALTLTGFGAGWFGFHASHPAATQAESAAMVAAPSIAGTATVSPATAVATPSPTTETGTATAVATPSTVETVPATGTAEAPSTAQTEDVATVEPVTEEPVVEPTATAEPVSETGTPVIEPPQETESSARASRAS